MGRHNGNDYYRNRLRTHRGDAIRKGIEMAPSSKSSVEKMFVSGRVTKAPCHKRRYKTRSDALLALSCARGASDVNGNRNECRCYKCEHCGGWHLTSKTIVEYKKNMKKLEALTRIKNAALLEEDETRKSVTRMIAMSTMQA